MFELKNSLIGNNTLDGGLGAESNLPWARASSRKTFCPALQKCIPLALPSYFAAFVVNICNSKHKGLCQCKR